MSTLAYDCCMRLWFRKIFKIKKKIFSGRSLPTNRLISAAQRHHHDFGGTEFLPLLLMNMCSGAEGGSGGCDGGGDGAGGSACGTIFV